MIFTRRNFLSATARVTGGIALSRGFLGRSSFAEEQSILVGSLHDYSGPIASSGQQGVAALTIAIDELNAAGGLLGRPLKLVHYDTQSSIQLYSQYAQQLALSDKVAVVHGGITSASREAVRPVFDRYRTLYFYNTLYEGGVCDRNTFCTGTTPGQTVQKLVPSALKRAGGGKAYIIAADYNYGQITAKWMAKYCQDSGGEILTTEFFPLDVTNFGPTISKIQERKPDIVLSALVGANHVGFYRQWAAAGMNGRIPIASTTFGLVNEPKTLEAHESNGLLGSYGYFEELDTPRNAAFVSALKAKFGDDIPYISEIGAATYEAMHLWAMAVKQAGTVEREKVIEALETGIAFDGPSGKVVVDKQTHHTTRNAYLAEVQEKRWVVAERYENQSPSDTAAVCDLVKNPNDNQQYVIGL
ncbi:urea ABC transporter substrate-binding protein [Taklimakanibacter deserti]|uniref:urea ABC transporter substrate-binding protein n=1 Tax=Taklimakanibacter deserti TaxID=2267839 RepID=UPI000E64888A